jgi:phosphoserine aminotransferase
LGFEFGSGQSAASAINILRNPLGKGEAFMGKRVHNFNPGPAALPLSVLEEIREEFLDFKGTGMSVIEVSHRSKQFEAVLNEAVERIKRLLKLGDDFHVLFIQGGASLQFTMVPMNLAVDGKPLDYIHSGNWANNAIKEAKLIGKDVRVIATSQDKNFSYMPKDFQVDKDASYLHITSNETIRGTQWTQFPEVGVPLVSDMSSDFMSRPFDVRPFGLIYAGAQKNVGPSGSAVVIIRKDMLGRSPSNLPTMFRYTTFAENNSLHNTPACFVIYVICLVLKWLEEKIGGLEAMERVNGEKAKLLYDFMDQSGFYRGTAEKESRSFMNIPFRLPTEDLEAKFVAEATKAGLAGLKGHRSVGGCRDSIYNATGVDAVKDLVSFMADFQKKAG